LYRRFGFRQIEETRFISTLVPRLSTATGRELSLDCDDDLALLNQAFSNRAPTSRLASACDHPALFMLKAQMTPEIRLIHLSEINAVVAIMENASSLVILDIIAPRIPSVDEIISAIAFTGQQVEVHLTPDCFSLQTYEKQPIDNGYMVRGPFAPEGHAFMLSDMRT
jgi:hypothetical protein